MNANILRIKFLNFINAEKSKIIVAPKLVPFVYDLNPTSLIYVDDTYNLRTFEKSLNKSSIIGIDTETKPVFSKGASNPTALIQIATRSSTTRKEEVFIIDLLQLNSSKTDLLLLDEILKEPLLEKNIIKLGQGLRSDFILLSRAYPSLNCFKNIGNIIEINSLISILEDTKTQISLREQVRIYLNNELIKKQQCSNWAARPLSIPQLHYAACDALVLLRLFDVLCYKLENKTKNNNRNRSCLLQIDHVINLKVESKLSFNILSKNIEVSTNQSKDFINNIISSDVLHILNNIQQSFCK